jgi:hypothetical protein
MIPAGSECAGILGGDNMFTNTAAIWLSAAIVLSAYPALAQEAPQCERLAQIEPKAVKNGLTGFSDDVLGKPALSWTQSDFDGLAATAKACDGHVAANGTVVESRDWEKALDAGAKAVLPTELAAYEARQKGLSLERSAITIPECQELLKWRRDPEAFTDSSAEIFGADFMTVPISDLDAAMQYASACGPFLVPYASGKYDMSKARTLKLLQDMVDAAYDWAAKRRAGEGQEGQVGMATVGGRPVPVTMAGERAQALVGKLASALERKAAFSQDDIAAYYKEAAAVEKEGQTDVDRAYARLVSKIINDRIFKSAAPQ